ncbi:phage tail protein [Pseudomonas proteolytica]|uniref:phage tail protein n=1 Tax=Pseudomonas proteolytica TaxID=219574 RepID=UPI001474765D|nr:phage tail protein [Pseudomonas proteolytica]NMZ37050.1 phage tail protein [Pseudomonas proteolytica]
MPWYKAGKVNVVSGQSSVTGVGTDFAANSLVGDAFIGPDGQWYEVINVPSPTTLSISPTYRSATVSNANYALMPVQGYQRELAIQAGAMIQQWGSTLAGLGTVSTFNTVPVANGGTGGTTPAAARSGLQLGSAAVAAILGTVSQSGGVPTGAILERVSNANGFVLKLADRTQICVGSGSGVTGTDLVNQYGAVGVTTAIIPVPFPAIFANTNYSFIAKSKARGMAELSFSRTTSSCSTQIRHPSASQTVDFDFIIIGEW